MCEMRPSTCIYVNCLNRLRFSAEVSTKLEAMYFFRQFKCHKQKGNMEATQMTSLFSCSFSTVTICNFHFHVVSPLVHSSLYKTSLLTNTTDSGSLSYFPREQTPEVTKNPYCVLVISSWTVILKIHIMF